MRVKYYQNLVRIASYRLEKQIKKLKIPIKTSNYRQLQRPIDQNTKDMLRYAQNKIKNKETRRKEAMGRIGEKDKQEIVKSAQKHKTDTGSSEVQIAVLTERIVHLVDHLKKHKKDHHTRRGLLILVGRRKKLMRYLQKKDAQSFKALAKQLNLKVKD